MENQYALYAYYAQFNPWLQNYAAFLPQTPTYTDYAMTEENVNEEMKMSSETASSEHESSPLQKH